jgi:putative heme iron utilization protein
MRSGRRLRNSRTGCSTISRAATAFRSALCSIFCRRHSLQFINIDGGAMFKVFVGRDEKRELLADQVARFGRLCDARTAVA